MLDFGWKVGISAAIGVALVAAVAVSYRHYASLVEANAALTGTVRDLEADVAREKSRADALSGALQLWNQAAERQAKALEDNTKAQREAGTETRRLNDVLSKHDLGALARGKPGLIENRVNAGTERTRRLLQQSTEGPAPDAGPPAASPRTAPAQVR